MLFRSAVGPVEYARISLCADHEDVTILTRAHEVVSRGYPVDEAAAHRLHIECRTIPGSEANEAGFKIARQYHRTDAPTGNRTKSISRYYAYHGTTLATLAAGGMRITDIDWLVPHQANIRIIQATARKLGMSMERIVVTVDRHANTSAASIPLALDEAVRDGRIRTGQHVLMEAIGGGFTWGAVLAKW